MTTTKNFNRTALCLMLFLTTFTVTLTSATTENNYNNDNSFLTNISESTHIENGYKTNIIINPHTTGIYAKENGYKLDLTINTQGISGSPSENGFKLDLFPEKTFPDISDIAVTTIATSKTVVGEGYSMTINVTVANQALSYETFHLIIKANTTNIKTQAITLTSGSSTTIIFTWNTTGFAKGNYTISAVAYIIPGEIDIEDNALAGGVIYAGIPGDLNADGTVDVFDAVTLSGAAGSSPGDVNWNPNADINNDQIVDIFDAVILSGHA